MNTECNLRGDSYEYYLNNKFDLTKEKIIDYIMKLDKAEVLAIKNNKKRFIKGKGFVDNIENSDILKELNTYETKIEELEKLLK